MSLLGVIRGWRASVVHASTKRIRWSHRSEPISRPAGLPLLRASSTLTTQAGTSEQSTSIEEAKLPQANNHGKEEHSDTALPEPDKPKPSTERLNADEKQVIIRMRKDGFSKFRIAEYLGRDLQAVHNALHELGAVHSMRRARRTQVQLSSSDLEIIESLRQQGMTWKVMSRQTSYGPDPQALQRTYTSEMIARGKSLPPERHLSAEDVQAIAVMRRDGQT